MMTILRALEEKARKRNKKEEKERGSEKERIRDRKIELWKSYFHIKKSNFPLSKDNTVKFIIEDLWEKDKVSYI